MRISDWSSDVCSSDLEERAEEETEEDEDEEEIDAELKRKEEFRALFLDRLEVLSKQAATSNSVLIVGNTHLFWDTNYENVKFYRSEERRVGKECVSQDKSGWSQ